MRTEGESRAISARRVVAAKPLGLGVTENAIQMLENAGSGFEHVALVDVFNRHRHDGRGDAGNRQFADGGVDVAFKGARRFGVMPGASFLLLHGELFASDRLEGVVGTSRIRCAVYPARCYRVFVFEQ